MRVNRLNDSTYEIETRFVKAMFYPSSVKPTGRMEVTQWKKGITHKSMRKHLLRCLDECVIRHFNDALWQAALNKQKDIFLC